MKVWGLGVYQNIYIYIYIYVYDHIDTQLRNNATARSGFYITFCDVGSWVDLSPMLCGAVDALLTQDRYQQLLALLAEE